MIKGDNYSTHFYKPVRITCSPDKCCRATTSGSESSSFPFGEAVSNFYYPDYYLIPVTFYFFRKVTG